MDFSDEKQHKKKRSQKEKQKLEIEENLFSKLVLQEVQIDYNAYFSNKDLDVYVLKKETRDKNERKRQLNREVQNGQKKAEQLQKYYSVLFDEYVAVFSRNTHLKLDEPFSPAAQDGQIYEAMHVYNIIDSGKLQGNVIIYKREVEQYSQKQRNFEVKYAEHEDSQKMEYHQLVIGRSLEGFDPRDFYISTIIRKENTLYKKNLENSDKFGKGAKQKDKQSRMKQMKEERIQ